MDDAPLQLTPRSFTVPVEDGQLHIQLLDLGKQTFVWLGHGEPQLENLSAATPTRLSSVPAVSNLLGSDDGAALAQRLALKTGRAVVVSSNLPASSPLLLAVAEKYLVRLMQAPLPSGADAAQSA